MKALNYILLTLLLLATACKPDQPEPDNNVWLPQELKDLFLVYPGSYWIFKELNTGYEDSIFVSATKLDTLPILHPGSRDTMGYKEFFVVTCISPFYGQTFEIATESPDYCQRLGPNAPCHYVAQRNIKNNKVERRSFIYFYPNGPGARWTTENDGLTFETIRIDSILPTFELQGQPYNQVRSVNITVDATLQHQASLRRIAPGVGIIQRKVDAMGWNWVVTRYHIVR